MPDHPATEVRLAVADAELADLPMFCATAHQQRDSDRLAASLDRFPGSAGTDTLPGLQLALSRFASLLTPTVAHVDL